MSVEASAPSDPPAAPLILTVRLDRLSQDRFNRERQRYFPAAINHLAAHVTMFHHLPGDALPAIAALLNERCAAVPPVRFGTTGLRFLGRGTAYNLAMPEVSALRAALATAWAGRLTAQDREPWRPHVTVQNKVAPAEARATHAILERGFAPQDGTALGLDLWRYLGGLWQALSHHAFSAGP